MFPGGSFTTTVLTIIIFCVIASGQEASILVPPNSLTVGVGSVANFSCNATGSLFNWFVDGERESNEMNRRRGISALQIEVLNGYVVGILTIPATTRNNNTLIYCSVAGTNGIRRSPTVALTVQGQLSPPSSLHILYFSDTYHHSLLWNAPFTLDLTNIEPDITSYTVCNNLTSHCVTTMEGEYTFPSLCDYITFSITAQNIVGEGNASSIIYEPRNHERPTNISSIETEVMFLSSNEPVITLQFQVDGNCYNLVQLLLVGKFSNQTTIFGPVIPIVTDTGRVEVILADITTNEVFYVTLISKSMERIPETSAETIVTTFDVQGESITCDQGVIKVTCIFARGSMAQGCLIVIFPVGNQSSTVQSERALRQELNGVLSRNASHSFNLSVDTYNIVMFDVEADGSVDQMGSLYNEIICVNPTGVSLSALPLTTSPVPTVVQGIDNNQRETLCNGYLITGIAIGIGIGVTSSFAFATLLILFFFILAKLRSKPLPQPTDNEVPVSPNAAYQMVKVQPRPQLQLQTCLQESPDYEGVQ